MKIIILKDIPKVGKKNELKDVSDGYALNYLFPKNLAKKATEKEVERLKEIKKEEERKAEANFHKISEMAAKIDGQEIEIPEKIGEKGELFEQITAAKVARRLKELGYEVKKDQVILENPIKEAGEYDISLKLDHNLEAGIKLIITEDK